MTLRYIHEVVTETSLDVIMIRLILIILGTFNHTISYYKYYQKAYKDLSKKYHPDRLSGLIMSPEESADMNTLFVNIKDAYEVTEKYHICI